MSAARITWWLTVFFCVGFVLAIALRMDSASLLLAGLATGCALISTGLLAHALWRRRAPKQETR